MLSSGKLGFWGLTALVFGLMVGVGIFNLPQNMASVAAPGSVFLAWIITGAGILPLVMVFKWLSTHYPQYNAGLYQYAQAGFGNYVGFNIAWGYWLCTAFSNVTFCVILNDSLGAIFPVMLNHNWPTVVFGTCLIWSMFWIVSRGIQTAKIINNLLSGIKIVMIVFIIIVFSLYFKFDMFDADIWGNIKELGTVGDQIKSTMMITLFCFFGVEGAVMMSARAKKSSDVGKAGVAGFLISLILYLAISLLCFGLMTRAKMSGLHDPSVAYILKDICGPWAYWIVIAAIIISLLGGCVSWTLVVAQVPYEASIVKILPPIFRKVNKHGMPAFGLFMSSLVEMLFLMMVVYADNVYLAALYITGLMIIPCYFFTALFLLKVGKSKGVKTLAIITLLFCCWMAYAGGLKELFMTSLFYLLGVGFYIRARRDNYPDIKQLFTRNEKFLLAFLILASAATIFMVL